MLYLGVRYSYVYQVHQVIIIAIIKTTIINFYSVYVLRNLRSQVQQNIIN